MEDVVEPDPRQRIIDVATVLFAEHGYHGVSTREIAAAAGLNIATVNYHVGTKPQLYAEVFRRAFQRELEVVEARAHLATDEVLADPGAVRDLFVGLARDLVELTRAHPETPRLWIRRWLEGESSDRIDTEFGLPLYRIVDGWLSRAAELGSIRRVDHRHFLIGFTWMLYGFFTGGSIDWDKVRTSPGDPGAVEAFEDWVCEYVCRMLGLPEEET